jgi:hypothetical protein
MTETELLAVFGPLSAAYDPLSADYRAKEQAEWQAQQAFSKAFFKADNAEHDRLYAAYLVAKQARADAYARVLAAIEHMAAQPGYDEYLAYLATQAKETR